MLACTFFGHRDCPDSLKARLQSVVIDLITNHDVDMFYVGNQGGFDRLVRGVLREIMQEAPGRNMPLCWPTRPQELLPPILPTLCCRRASNWFIRAMPSPGATIGCYNNLTL